MDHQVEEIVEKYQLETRETTLAVGGGFCLNCPTNAYLMKKYRFKRFQAPPCINDGGQALGIGLYEFYRRMGQFSFSFGENPFRGVAPKISVERIKMLKETSFVEKVTQYTAKQAANDLIKDVVVWFEDGAEIGPRALGHRSLLGNPTNPRTKKRLNEIKKREFWRPVAPIVKVEEGDEYFEQLLPSPFMLHTFRLRPEWKERLESISHIDGTARVQTVKKDCLETQKICEILDEMKKIVGVPIICNTSLNDKGEPIIETMERALDFAMEKKIVCVYINGWRIQLKNFDQYQGEFKEAGIPFVVEDSDKKIQFNPWNIEEESIRYILHKDRNRFDLSDKKDVEKAIQYIKKKKNRSLLYHE